MTLNFSSQELELLQRIVRQYYMNLRAEIYHTESSAFKKGLKDEEVQLQRLLEKIGGDVFYPCEPLKQIGGNLLREGSFRKVFARGRKLYGDIPPCQGICHLFGNVVSHY